MLTAMSAPMPELAHGLAHTLAVARALVRSGRDVDLSGLQDGVGLLCAKTLDMGPEQARGMLPALYALLHAFESLDSALRESATP